MVSTTRTDREAPLRPRQLEDEVKSIRDRHPDLEEKLDEYRRRRREYERRREESRRGSDAPVAARNSETANRVFV